jgi:hypothetical protein
MTLVFLESKINLKPTAENIRKLLSDDLSLEAIASRVGLSKCQLRYLINKLKADGEHLDIRQGHKKHRIFSREFLYQEHVINKKSINKICRENKCHYQTVNNYLKLYGIEKQLYLGSGMTKSKAKSNQWKGHGNIPGWYIGRVKRRAIVDLNIEYNVTPKYLDNLFQKQNKQCIFSGVMLEFTNSDDRKNTTASLDRIDSRKGYVEGNLQWVHKDINKMKLTMSNNEFKKWCELVYKKNM